MNIAVAIPATPGQVGVHEAGSIAALRLVGVSEVQAIPFALLYHVTQLLPVLVLGMASLRFLSRSGEPLPDEPAEGGPSGRDRGLKLGHRERRMPAFAPWVHVSAAKVVRPRASRVPVRSRRSSRPARPVPPPSVDLAAAGPQAVVLAPVVPRPAVSASGTDLRVIVGGDLLPHRPMLVPAERLHAGLLPLGPLLASVDVAIANYETATGSTDLFQGKRSMSLAAPREWLEEAGTTFHAVTVANNHACDLGRAGLTATLSAAKELGVTRRGGNAESRPVAAPGDRREGWQERCAPSRGPRS